MEIGPKQEILLPVKPRFIAFSLLAGFLLNLLPMGGPLEALRPDFMAMILLYWCIHQPMRIGIGAAWIFGILMDVADGALFGEHALAYSLMAFIALALRRRMSMLQIGHQFTHVTLILLIMQAVVVLTGLIAKNIFVGWTYFLGSVTAGLLWPFLSYLLKLPQRPKPDPDRI
jgi:rod shape-determining protein MreD